MQGIIATAIRRGARAGAAAAILLLAATGARAQTLHAIIAADTNDSSIGTSVVKDYDKQVALVTAAATGAGMTLNLVELTGDSLSLDRLRSAVGTLRVGSDDTVMFFYAGHGFRSWEKKGDWPSLYIDGKGLDFDDVIASLRNKKPRLLIAITDSCNEYIDGIPRATMRAMKRAAPRTLNYRKLWREAKGHIYIASSSKGEYAWGDDEVGGFFTERWTNAVNAEPSRSDPKWETILASAKNRISTVVGGTPYSQQPLVEYRISYVTAAVTPAKPATKPAVAWVPFKNQQIKDMVSAGRSGPGSYALCRAPYNKGVHPGKVEAGACSIGWGGKEVKLRAYEVMSAPADGLEWVAGAGGRYPANAVIAGAEPGRRLPVCRAAYKGGVHPGKIVARNCNFSHGGREITVPRYEVLTGDPGKFRWVKAAPGAAVREAFIAGNDGRVQRYAVCQGKLGTVTVAGKAFARRCFASHAGRDRRLGSFAILAGDAGKVTWVKSKRGAKAPETAVVAGTAGKAVSHVCRARARNGVYPGYTTATGCSIGVGGREIRVPVFEVMTAAEVPAK